jgi:hypothetical protein
MVRFDPLQKWAPRRRNAAIGGYETPSWFHKHGEEEVSWADLVALGEQTGQRLVTAAKGIYKPEGSRTVAHISNSIVRSMMPS